MDKLVGQLRRSVEAHNRARATEEQERKTRARDAQRRAVRIAIEISILTLEYRAVCASEEGLSEVMVHGFGLPNALEPHIDLGEAMQHNSVKVHKDFGSLKAYNASDELLRLFQKIFDLGLTARIDAVRLSESPEKKYQVQIFASWE